MWLSESGILLHKETFILGYNLTSTYDEEDGVLTTYYIGLIMKICLSETYLDLERLI